MTELIMAGQQQAPVVSLFGNHDAHRVGRRVDRGTVRRRLAIGKEMVATMETLTGAGQRFQMSKLVVFLDDEFQRCFGAAPGTRRRVIAWWLRQLHGEAERVSPDAAAFSRRAETVIEAISAAV